MDFPSKCSSNLGAIRRAQIPKLLFGIRQSFIDVPFESLHSSFGRICCRFGGLYAPFKLLRSGLSCSGFGLGALHFSFNCLTLFRLKPGYLTQVRRSAYYSSRALEGLHGLAGVTQNVGLNEV